MLGKGVLELGVGIVAGFGLTEYPMCGMAAVWDHTDKLAHTEGRPSDGTEFWVLDENGRRVGPNIDGEIRVRGPHLFVGYVDPALDVDALIARFRKRTTGVKVAMLNQSLVSGIGNIYADEALWAARIHYATPADRIRPIDYRRLFDAVRSVMTTALDAGGTSFDALYVNVNGESGYFDVSLNAYGQEGKPCARCDTLIVREPWQNRSSHFCPACQRSVRTRR